MDRPINPLHESMLVIPIEAEGKRYHHQSGPDTLNPALIELINPGRLVDLLLQERWKGQCEIVPNYVHKYAQEGEKPICVIRYHVKAHNDRQEDTYSYLRYSQGPRQGFFWDIYGDNFHSVELALLALHQAPAPYYCGPIISKFTIRK